MCVSGTGTGSTGALTGGTDKISSSISSSGSTDRVAGECEVETSVLLDVYTWGRCYDSCRQRQA
jgi:hypothetical protein